MSGARRRPAKSALIIAAIMSGVSFAEFNEVLGQAESPSLPSEFRAKGESMSTIQTKDGVELECVVNGPLGEYIFINTNKYSVIVKYASGGVPFQISIAKNGQKEGPKITFDQCKEGTVVIKEVTRA